MKVLYPSIGLGRLCKLFGKTRQGYYDHSWRICDEQLQQAVIIELVQSIRKVLPKVGGNKLLFMLKEDFAAHHISIGRDCFFRLLKDNDLLVKKKRRYVRTTQSNHHFKKWPDLTTGLEVKAIEQLWVSDITYLSTQNGFIYLSLITDAYSHKIVGYHLSQQLKVQGCLIALHKAVASLKDISSLIHHSDRGIQYCCDAYVQVLQQNKIAISMTQSGSPYDNAVAERVNGILKTELNLEKTFVDYNDAVMQVHQAIDVYNRIRPHMSCGNLTPAKAHQSNKRLQKLWKPKQYCKAKSVSLSNSVKPIQE
ncbi:MAG: IS3 family transposase [Bacteroidota bacterium]|nr:IS3 family transposase [Bacteroidota bacterium]